MTYARTLWLKKQEERNQMVWFHFGNSDSTGQSVIERGQEANRILAN